MTGKDRQDEDHKEEDRGTLLCWIFPRLGSPKMFAFLLFTTIVIATAPGGYIGGVASTLEKRFQLKSSEIAFLNIIFDISSLATLFFVTHYGHNRHRGRVIGVVYILAGIGALCNALPHFFYGVPKALQDKRGENSTEFLCGGLECEDDNSISLRSQTVWIAIASILASFSSATLPLAMPYIDDSVGKRSTAIYAAIILCSYSIGGVLGFFLATIALTVPAYPLHVGEPGYPAGDSKDPNYLGAWWLGYLIMGFALLIVSPMFLMFPKTLRKTDGRQKEDAEAEEASDTGEEAKEEHPERKSLIEHVKYFLWTLLQSLGRILRNPTIILLTLSGAIQFNTFAGLQLFGAKYLEVQFYLPAAFSSVLFGILLIPSGIIGNLVGGLVTKWFGHSNLKIGYIMMVFIGLAILLDPVNLFLGCDNRLVKGVNVPYTQGFEGEITLDGTCNKDCNCDVDYEPVCANYVEIYFSPCHAGCKSSFKDAENRTVFADCACIGAGNGTAVEGICPTYPCGAWLTYFLLGLVASCIYTMFAIPGFMLGLRCVDEQDRSITLGLANFCSKVLGSIPGPIIYGAFLDFPCEVHLESKCQEGTGNCLIYDNRVLRLSYNGLTFAIHFIVAALAGGAVYTIWQKQRKNDAGLTEGDPPLEMNAKEGFENKAYELKE